MICVSCKKEFFNGVANQQICEDCLGKNKNKKTSRDLLWCGLSNIENGANSFTAKKKFFWAFFRAAEILLKIEARIIQCCLDVYSAHSTPFFASKPIL